MKIKTIVNIFCILFAASCSTSGKLYYRLNNSRLVNKLVESNGNAFQVSSTYITISYVWSYAEKEVLVYKLSKGKIVDRETYPIFEKPAWILPPSKEELFELDTCMELDGDMFGYWIRDAKNSEMQNLPINISCFRQGKYNSNFLNQVVNDMITYRIEWVE